jgi:hypothetical protein
VINKEEVEPDHGRVTAGIPSLDSSKRSEIASSESASDFHNKIHAETESKREDSVAPDGQRDRTNREISRGKEWDSRKLQKKLQQLASANGCSLHFIRPPAAPSQVGVYLIVPVTPDEDKGLRYIGGFNADRPVKEFDWICVREKVARDRNGTPHVTREQCSGCPNCKFLGCERGWRPMLFRLLEAGIITRSQAESFGPPSKDSQNWQRAMALIKEA